MVQRSESKVLIGLIEEVSENICGWWRSNGVERPGTDWIVV